MADSNNIMNSRVEIDTSPPFESVKEAVDHFGGSGPWIPHHLLRLPPPPHHDSEEVDVEKMEEQAAKFEKDLIVKEQEAHIVLKEVEAAKTFVQGLKLNLMQQVSHLVPTPENAEKGHVLMELKRAKLDLNKMSTDLTVIRSSVETLNNKMKKEKVLLDGSSHRNGFEAEQFKKMAEASRYEVMKAMSEIERTKASIRMAEMRLHAAKKMEEAAKAVEAIALLNGNNSTPNDGITISYQEYYALARKAQQAEELCKTKFVDTSTMRTTNEANQSQVAVTKTMEEIRHNRSTLEEALDNEDGFYRERSEHTQLHYSGHNSANFRFRNPQSSLTSHGNPRLVNVDEPEKLNDKPGILRSSISIGDILSRKLILQDDHIVVGNHVESRTERQHVSFSQMLREQSGIILNPTKAVKDGNVHKQYISQKKKFGFIQVPLSKQNKKKTQPLNMT